MRKYVGKLANDTLTLRVFAKLARTLFHSATFMSWLAISARIGGNGVLIFLIAIKFEPTEIAVLFFLLTINNIYWMADLGLSPLLSRLFAYGFGGATLEQILGDLKRSQHTDHEPGVPNWTTIRTMFDLQHVFLGLIAFFSFVVGGILASWLLLPQISKLDSPIEGWLSWGIVLLSSTISLGGKAYGNFLLGGDRIAIQKRYETLVSAITAFAGVASILIYPKLLFVCAVYFGFPALSVFINRRITYRVYDGKLRRDQKYKFRRDVAKALWPQTWRMSVGILMGQVILNFSSLIVTRNAEPLLAAQLLFSLRFVRILDTFSAAPITVTLPSMARLYFQGLTHDFGKVIKRSLLLSLPIIVLPGLIIAFGGKWALKLIGSKVDFLPPSIWLLLVFGATLMRYGAVHLQIVTVQNRVLWHFASGVFGVIFLSCLFFSVPFFPVATAYALAYAAGALLFYAPYSVVHSYKLLDRDGRRDDFVIVAAHLGLLLVGILISFYT